jgi:hypothetical protein
MGEINQYSIRCPLTMTRLCFLPDPEERCAIAGLKRCTIPIAIAVSGQAIG